ncbi:hypothetical protein MesoLj113c_46220 [Mesorhizobium sp. 113-3-9]|uniref:hypothetical protein n=1 Tax=Mesorhizobium sp. 113-3-9 TaxID=2744517 RepID=UPI0019270308|nr:hypothetical protein [Mesorhizobium sp. 113-3-9]BCG88512.1 hypothetical protein MesoLj113c_46220 [Mesorhizobium sp. 113-3-9]
MARVRKAEAPAGWDGISQFRKLWNGGEHRRAYDLATAAELSEDDWAVLHGEFPELLELINT